MSKETIESRFKKADQDRATLLAHSRDYASLTIPEVLPPANQDENTELPSCWTNIGGEGTENMIGRLLTSLYPVGLPWFRMDISTELRASRTISTEDKNRLISMIWQRELLTASRLEATNYRVASRAALESLIICGNALTRQANDYNLRYFQFNDWVCKRDGAGNPLWTITKEAKYAIELKDEDRAKAGIKDGDEEKRFLFTKCERVRVGDGDGEGEFEWHIQQELNEVILFDNKDNMELVNPYNCVAYRLCPGKDYSRGFVSTRFPDLKSANGLWEALNLGMANAAKMVPVVDASEPNIRMEDLTKANGKPITGRVVGGVVQGVAFLTTGKSTDFSIALTGAQHIETRLGRSMLLEAASMPKGERVTATAVMRIARELEGALGGPYAHIADEMQKPLLEHTVYMLEQATLLPAISRADKKRLVKIDILTGSAALAKEMRFSSLMNAIQQIATLPGELERIDFNVIADRILYYAGADAEGVMKSPEQVAKEAQAKLQQEMQGKAGEQAIETIGAVVEQRAAEQAKAGG